MEIDIKCGKALRSRVARREDCDAPEADDIYDYS